MTIASPDRFVTTLVTTALQREIDERISKAVEEASEKLKKDIRALAPRVLLGITEAMSVSWEMGPTMVVRIEFKEPTKGISQ